jgi:hypothetical protein
MVMVANLEIAKGHDERILARRLVSYAEAGAVREHACGNIHGEKLLEEQFGGIGNVDLRDAGFVMTRAAFVRALLVLTRYCVSTYQ